MIRTWLKNVLGGGEEDLLSEVPLCLCFDFHDGFAFGVLSNAELGYILGKALFIISHEILFWP